MMTQILNLVPNSSRMTLCLILFYLISIVTVVNSLGTVTTPCLRADLETARRLHAGTFHNTKAIFVSGITTNTIEVFDQSTHSWVTENTTVTTRNSLTATTNTYQEPHLAFFAGGIDSVASNIVNIFNGTEWATTNLSQARFNLASASVNQFSLFAGGRNGSTRLANVDIYNATDNSWSTSNLFEPRELLTAVTLNELVFFAGGSNGSARISTVDIWNATTESWMLPAALSQARSDLASASIDGEVALFAGGISSARSNVVDLYWYSNSSWTTATLSVARSHLGSAVACSKAYFAGGDNGFDVVNTIDIFNLATLSWTTSTLQVARKNLIGVVANGLIVFAGGSDDSSVALTTVDLICDCVQCDDPFISNSTLTCSNNFFYESECSVECSQGFEKNGSTNNITCLSNSLWQDVPSCELINCGILTIINGTANCPNGTLFQHQCSIFCSNGYSINGTSSSTCQENQQWTTPGTCMPVNCGNLSIGNASVNCSGTIFQSTCSIDCDQGFTLQGSDSVECKSSGIWGPNLPTCVPDSSSSTGGNLPPTAIAKRVQITFNILRSSLNNNQKSVLRIRELFDSENDFGATVIEVIAQYLGEPQSRFRLTSVTDGAQTATTQVSFFILPTLGGATPEQLNSQLQLCLQSQTCEIFSVVPSGGKDNPFNFYEIGSSTYVAQDVTMTLCEDGVYRETCFTEEESKEFHEEDYFPAVITIIVIVGLFLIALAAFFIYKYKKKENDKQKIKKTSRQEIKKTNRFDAPHEADLRPHEADATPYEEDIRPQEDEIRPQETDIRRHENPNSARNDEVIDTSVQTTDTKIVQ